MKDIPYENRSFDFGDFIFFVSFYRLVDQLLQISIRKVKELLLSDGFIDPVHDGVSDTFHRKLLDSYLFDTLLVAGMVDMEQILCTAYEILFCSSLIDLQQMSVSSERLLVLGDEFFGRDQSDISL